MRRAPLLSMLCVHPVCVCKEAQIACVIRESHVMYEADVSSSSKWSMKGTCLGNSLTLSIFCDSLVVDSRLP